MPSARFSQEVATSFARSPMRKLTTPELEVYYPEGAGEAAHAMAARMSDCLVRLRARTLTQRPRARALVYLTDANFNNAYVTGQSDGEPLHTVNPLYATSEGFHLSNLNTTAIGDIGCHELLHYVHYEQVDGLWRAVNAVFGELVPPQAFLERWFTEGLAQYYEGRLGGAIGRPHSPLYRAEFESVLAARGGWIGAGDLVITQRELYPSSGAYLTGLHFIEHLADKYGEAKLWELIDLQGRSVFSPFGVALRFKAVYGLSLGALIDGWSAESQSKPRDRVRPPDQHKLVDAVGYAARLASAPDGTLAMVSAGRDEVPKLKILEPDGRLRAELTLATFLPMRDWVSAGPSQTSGMSFTADSRWLYLMNDDVTSIGDSRAQLWKIDAQTAEVVTVWPDVGGLGGAVHPSGDRYLFIDLSPGRSELTELDLRTGKRRALTTGGQGITYAAPAWAPDGKTIAFSRHSTLGWDLWVRGADGAMKALTADGQFNYGAKWIDAQRVLFMREHDGRSQAHLLDTTTGAIAVVTDAPFSAFDVTPLPGDRLAFLDREGWNWSLDTAPLASRAAITVRPVRAEPEAPAQPALVVESDQPYRPLEGFFFPLLRVPAVVNVSGGCGTEGCHLDSSYSFLLAGRDRLGFHNWALAASLSLPAADYALAAYYSNQTQAPWSIDAYAAFDNHSFTDDVLGPGRVETTSAALSVGRAFFTTPINLSVGGFREWDSQLGVSHFFGPSLGFDYFAGEATVYGGLKRALGVAAQVSLYPENLSSYSVVDLQGTLTLGVPLPLLSRHSLLVTIDGRAIEGAPEGALQVGGVARGYDLLRINARQGESGPTVPLPGSFSVPVRGYEDYSVRANRAAAAVARYRYPFVIDRGFASIFYLLPSLFFRQVDLDAFGSAALTDAPAHPWLRAVGAGVSVRALLGGAIPISIYYRWAWRLDERLMALHSFGFAFE
ncbi:MAG: hypothetical protein H6Q89_1204 [Myxococcaceae bacterium]|nr:hypothetical protein [Myxococcaceae bacterium]